MKKFSRKRRVSGSALVMVICNTMIACLVGIGLIFLGMLFGGSREGTNANDSGTLNVGKLAPRLQVSGTAAENAYFQPVSENGRYSLKSINRVWGSTLLILLNSRSMQATGTASGQSNQNATNVWNSANSLSGRLANTLKTQAKLEPYFRDLAHKNGLRMLDSNQELKPLPKWRTALMNRQGESNLRYYANQLPPNVNLSPAALVTMPDHHQYFRGYFPINLGNGRYVNFVPFEFRKQPHLVSLKKFDQETLAKHPYPQWQNPVPNAFECKSQTGDMNNLEHKFDATAICNTMRQSDLELPQGFIKINLRDDTVRWFPQFIPGIPVSSETVPKQKTMVHQAYLLDVLNPLAWFEPFLNVGHQYYDFDGRRTVYKALYAAGVESDYPAMNRLLLNRANEIKPGTSWAQIVNLLRSKTINGAGDSFVLARNRANQLFLANTHDAADLAQLNPSVSYMNHADGSMTQIKKQKSFSLNNLVLVLHWEIDKFGIPIPKPIAGGTIWRHSLDMVPGTGANGALFEVTQYDTTYAFWGDGSGSSPLSDGGSPVTGGGGCGCF
ncbi:MAG: hypothetical protein K2X27_15350 [Candidatus Obscuribacterales bacterium]|nr:hypothetical protein [Candidatus Obscuribacterales bacterium]